MNNGIIAFCGSKGSGKSTSYGIFSEIYTGATEEIALAGHLKEVCAQVFGVDYNAFIDPSLKEVELDNYVVLDRDNLKDMFKAFYFEDIKDEYIRPHIGKVLPTPRRLLQYIGTDVLHPVDPLIHVKIAVKKKDPTKLTVVTDLRFIQEFNYFKENVSKSFVPVYVKNTKAEAAASIDPHPSERQLEEFKRECVLLDNEGSLIELREGIKTLIANTFNDKEEAIA